MGIHQERAQATIMKRGHSARAEFMIRIALQAGCLLVSVSLAGCGTFGQFGQTLGQKLTPSGELTPQQRVQITEDRLTAAGFKAVSPQTSAEMERYKKLPPTELTYKIGVNGQLTYYFADPTYCHCYFSGSEEAYQRYQRQKRTSQQVRREQRADQLGGAEVQRQEMQLMGPFGIDSPLGGSGPGSNFYSY
jgi:hypothetical protein